MDRIRSYKELRVYQAAIDAAIESLKLSKGFQLKSDFNGRPKAALFTFGLLEHWRGVAQAPLSSTLQEQVERLRRRSGRNTSLVGFSVPM